jgi:hypothetical protein
MTFEELLNFKCHNNVSLICTEKCKLHFKIAAMTVSELSDVRDNLAQSVLSSQEAKTLIDDISIN